jgi:hypothetical protein
MTGAEVMDASEEGVVLIIETLASRFPEVIQMKNGKT